MSKLKEVWKRINEDIIVNKREMVLIILLAFVIGIVLGMIISPKKDICIGSNNGSNNGNDNHKEIYDKEAKKQQLLK